MSMNVDKKKVMIKIKKFPKIFAGWVVALFQKVRQSAVMVLLSEENFFFLRLKYFFMKLIILMILDIYN